MKFLKIFTIISAVIVVAILVALILLPEENSFERSIVINKPASEVFKEVNSFKNFNEWSPWHKMDPDAKYEYSGPESGVGAKISWAGEEAGIGSQEIIESKANEYVKNKLLFDGFDDPSYAEFKLSETSEGTQLTWSYSAKMGGFYKFFGAIMENLLGPQYEEGLKELKTYMEGKD